MAFDPKGQTLASASEDATVKLWETGSGELIGTFEGHKSRVRSVTFDPPGGMLASGSDDTTVRQWDADTRKCLGTLEGHWHATRCVAFRPSGQMLASGGDDDTIKLWEASSSMVPRTLEGHRDWVLSVAFDPSGQVLASASADGTVKLWNVEDGKLLRSLEDHKDGVQWVAFAPSGRTLASAGGDTTVKLWEVTTGKLLRTIEGHAGAVKVVAFSSNGQLLASGSDDGTIRLWSCDNWETLAIIPEAPQAGRGVLALAFHPSLPLLATVGPEPYDRNTSGCREIQLWEVRYESPLSKERSGKPRSARGSPVHSGPGTSAALLAQTQTVHRTTAKIVLVGDAGVGKTGLGWRLAHREFKEHASTHGQQFWVLNQLGKRRADGTECEAILWDLAGQPDYRLIHALFLDDADLALVLFDPTDSRDPLHGVEFWLKQITGSRGLKTSISGGISPSSACPVLLVAARSDRGTVTLTREELEAFCRLRGVKGYVSTSAVTGEGLDDLIQRMKLLIPWDDKPATVTTLTFRRIRDYLLELKENKTERQVVLSPEQLRQRLQKTDTKWQFTDAQMMTAVGHLENYGYAKRLRTSKGERILVAPEMLNNLAASLILEARRNPKGLGSLEENRLLAGEYLFRELEGLSKSESDIVLDSAVLLFLEHHVCFRETDPLSGQS